VRQWVDDALLLPTYICTDLTAGLDYTVAHYGIITSSPRLDAVLTFVDDSSPEAADNWAVGEVSNTRRSTPPATPFTTHMLHHI